MKKVVIDTNCLLVVIPSKSPFHKIWEHFIEGKIVLCVSNEILLEYEEIISQKQVNFLQIW